MMIRGRSLAPILLLGLASLTSPLQAQAIEHRSAMLSHELAGFSPPAEDRAARGAELLAAGPGSQIAFYSAPEHRVLLLEDLDLVHDFSVHGASDLAFTEDGDLLILEDPTRSLSLWSPEGQLLSVVELPELVPLGGRLEVIGMQIRVRDLFGGLHRAASIEGQRLGPAQGALLIPQDSGLVWERSQRVLWVDGQAWPLPHALQASAQRVGSRWLLIDEVIGEAPLEVRRTAHDLKTGSSVALPVEDRVYTPRRDVTEDFDGRLLYLYPQIEGLEIVEVQP
jgi:hypothetical protein